MVLFFKLVQEQKVIAFSVAEGRSGEIRESLVLPGLLISVVEEALQRSQAEDDGAIIFHTRFTDVSELLKIPFSFPLHLSSSLQAMLFVLV